MTKPFIFELDATSTVKIMSADPGLRIYTQSDLIRNVGIEKKAGTFLLKCKDLNFYKARFLKKIFLFI